MSCPRPVYELVLAALPDAVPGSVRRKRVLKLLGRYRLKCLSAREATAEAPPAKSDAKSQGNPDVGEVR
jgi:hypothetical protein